MRVQFKTACPPEPLATRPGLNAYRRYGMTGPECPNSINDASAFAKPPLRWGQPQVLKADLSWCDCQRKNEPVPRGIFSSGIGRRWRPTGWKFHPYSHRQ